MKNKLMSILMALSIGLVVGCDVVDKKQIEQACVDTIIEHLENLRFSCERKCFKIGSLNKTGYGHYTGTVIFDNSKMHLVWDVTVTETVSGEYIVMAEMTSESQDVLTRRLQEEFEKNLRENLGIGGYDW